MTGRESEMLALLKEFAAIYHRMVAISDMRDDASIYAVRFKQLRRAAELVDKCQGDEKDDNNG